MSASAQRHLKGYVARTSRSRDTFPVAAYFSNVQVDAENRRNTGSRKERRCGNYATRRASSGSLVILHSSPQEQSS